MLLWAHVATAQQATWSAAQVRTVNGVVEGVVGAAGLKTFKGIPFAKPPVGELRFREPQPVQNWEGIRKADKFGPRAMQLPLFSDMNFRSDGVSEDCLYLNVWTPAKAPDAGLPVFVYFFGGGFVAGDGSEFRYDGESMAMRGVVTVTINYRLGIFGFLAHPELTKESAHHSSGNCGLMDQHAALVWVQQNIAAFGGDPKRVTIGGESAGSNSVSAQMASPLSTGLFAGAIGESGSLLGRKPMALADAEQVGVSFAAGLGNKSLAGLRAMSADALLAATAKAHFPVTVDGYFFPTSPLEIFATGNQMAVPLLAGWNSAEQNYGSILGKDEPTVENYEKAVRKLYGAKADEVLKLYKATTPDEVQQAATDLGTDRFIAFGTWKWIDQHSKTGHKPVYRYLYAHPRPAAVGAAAVRSMGAGHSWEIEYALGNLSTNTVYAWKPEDARVSETMEAYFANFIKTADPNGKGLPVWPAVKPGVSDVMVIDVKSRVEKERNQERYRWMEGQ